MPLLGKGARMFCDEWLERFEELEDMLRECDENGGDWERDMPEVYEEWQDMRLIYETEFF